MTTPRPPLPVALQDRAFLTVGARPLGLTDTALRSRRFVRLSRGVRYADDDPGLAERVLATLRVLPPGTVVTGCTGLHLWGVSVGPPVPLTFVSTHPHQTRRVGVRVIRRAGPAPASRRASAATCFVDAATDLDLVDLVVAGDWLVRLRLASPASLAAAVVSGRPGARRARRAAALVRSGSESPRETRVRLLAVLAGLPNPDCNPDVYDGPTWLGRCDLVWSTYRVIVEYDGGQHLTDPEQWERDVLRLEALERAGWTVIRVTARRLRKPHALLADLQQALRRGGWDGRVVLTAEWQQAFIR